MKKTIFAIIGFGYMGEWHYRKISSISDIIIKYVFDVSPIRKKIAISYGLNAPENVEIILNDAEIDAVIIATPNHLHEYYINLAIEHGKHIICEKPVTLSYKTLYGLIMAAEKKQIVFTAHFNRRWDNDFQEIAHLIKNCNLGQINYVESRICSSYGHMYGWRAEKNAGGGLLYDWGPHLIDQALFLNKNHQLIRISYSVKSIRTGDVDDYFRLKLDFSNGIDYYIECGIMSLIPVPRWRIYGRNGTVSTSDSSQLEVLLLDDDSLVSNDRIPINGNKDSSRLMSGEMPKTNRLQLSSFSHVEHSMFYKNFCQAIFNFATPFISTSDMLRVSAVIDMIKGQPSERGSFLVNI